jgi:hypothetical protein
VEESLFDPSRKPSRFLFLDTHPEKLLGGNVPKTERLSLENQTYSHSRTPKYITQIGQARDPAVALCL